MKKKLIILALIFNLWNSIAFGKDRQTYELTIKDHKFNIETLKVQANTKIKLIVYNEDDTVEEFESLDLKREKLIPPHSKITLLVGPLKPGEYKFFGDFHQETAQGTIVAE